MNERYIVIPNWDRHQHYKDKTRPAWIKLHTSLLHDNDWLNLTDGQRSALIGIWLLYASTGRHLTAATRSLSHQLGQRVSSQTLAALNQAGFIEFRSRDALEKLYTREEKRREEKISKDVSSARDETAERKNHRGKNRTPTEAEIVEARERREQSGYIEDLGSYTGCRIVRGEVGISHIYDPLGMEYPPTDWPHPRPTKVEIAAALQAKQASVA